MGEDRHEGDLQPGKLTTLKYSPHDPGDYSSPLSLGRGPVSVFKTAVILEIILLPLCSRGFSVRAVLMLNWGKTRGGLKD